MKVLIQFREVAVYFATVDLPLVGKPRGQTLFEAVVALEWFKAVQDTTDWAETAHVKERTLETVDVRYGPGPNPKRRVGS